MSQTRNFNTFSTGLAMFSMFFGAGNVVFPLALGHYAGDQAIFAILGLLITAVGVPFLGLIAMTLFHGNYQHFFSRMGVLPGLIISGLIMGLIGPFGAIPRCIALAYSTISTYMPGISLPWFSIGSCILMFFLTYRRSNLVAILSYILTPILIGSLVIIIVIGLFTSPSAPVSEFPPVTVFFEGLKQGYQTMDLLGAFFFSSVALLCLKQGLSPQQMSDFPLLLKLTLRASVVGALLLGGVYIGFSYLASFHSETLTNVRADDLISQIALRVLGDKAGIVVCIAVALACLTTAIALSAVFADYLHEEVCRFKLNYVNCLIITLAIAFFISTLNFTVIIKFLAPILEVCYPALITLSIFNILYKMYGWTIVKTPVYAVFAVSLAYYMLQP